MSNMKIFISRYDDTTIWLVAKLYLKQKHLGCTKSVRPIRSSYIIVLATKQFDIRVGQEATTITVLATRRFDIRVGQEAAATTTTKL